MKTVHMIDDYRNFCANCRDAGKFESYKKYTAAHKIFFDAVFRYLYHSPVETLRGYIEGIDFGQLLRRGEQNYDRGICDYIISVAERSAELMNVDFEFELMLGMELGNIGGCSVPREDKSPYLYIGIDRDLTRESIDIFVPHEMHHMIHSRTAPQTETETLLTRAAEEGLASFLPMRMYGMEWNADNVSRLISVSPKQAAFLIDNAEQIAEKAIVRKNDPLTPQIMQEYFCFTDTEAEIALPGYFVGLYFTYLAVRNGADFNRFSAMPNDGVADFWLKNYKNWK